MSARHCPDCGERLEPVPAGRMQCPGCGRVVHPDPKVAVGVLLVRDGQLLLVRRLMDPQRGAWALPGGFVDAGQGVREVAAREALEETGLRVRVGQLLEVFSGGPTVFLLFAASGLDPQATPQPGDDADAAAFFPPHRLPSPLAFESTPWAVRHWLAGSPASAPDSGARVP